MENIITALFTGLITGGLTCMAVQGGLLAATIAQRQEEKLKNNLQKGGNALPIISFLTTKLIAYTILGFLLGMLGSFFTLSITATILMQLIVIIFMLGTAFNILNVHPIFRYFVIQPPKFLTRFIRKQSKSQDLFAPAVLGVFTVFIPCGTTQAMMALSIASANPLIGAGILFAFVLGTSPLFFIFGYFATKLGEALEKKFMKIAAIALILLSIYTLNNTFALTGFSLNIGNPIKQVFCIFAVCDNNNSNSKLQINNNPTITINSLGYFPSTLAVKNGEQIKMKVINTDGAGCQQAFTIPSLGVQKVIPPGSSELIEFIAPNKPTQIPFMCSMGMFRGVINVL